MKRNTVLWAAAVLVGLLLSGCMGETETLIQGTWEYRDKHLMTVASEKHLTIVWNFNHGSFTYWACCMNIDEEFSGRYRVLSVDEDIITLELFNMRNMSSRSTIQIRIVIDRENEQLNIQGTGPFDWITP